MFKGKFKTKITSMKSIIVIVVVMIFVFSMITILPVYGQETTTTTNITAASKEFIENLRLNNPDLEKNIIYKPLWLNEIRVTINSLLYNNDQQ